MITVRCAPFADVRDLLDDHGPVLAGQLRERAVRASRAARQVAGAADLVGLLAVLHVRGHVQGLELLAHHLVPDVALRLDALRLGLRLRGDGQGGCDHTGRHGRTGPDSRFVAHLFLPDQGSRLAR
jgi:hypothetical protein